jgi:tetratricopeptide (TPR) repeat protein
VEKNRAPRDPWNIVATVAEKAQQLLEHFRAAFREDPSSAYRDWFRLQEELREREEAETARVLADDLWSVLEALTFSSAEERARFFHNVAVFFGSPGPAADIARAREGFAAALAHFREHEDSGWHARVLHNFATSLSNLGSTPEDLSESVALFQRALAWRTPEREIARGVTLHNMGIALRRLAELDRARAGEHLSQSAAALREAADIRERHGLAEGRALSLFHLGMTHESSGETAIAAECFDRAAEAFELLGKTESAAVARDRKSRIER